MRRSLAWVGVVTGLALVGFVVLGVVMAFAVPPLARTLSASRVDWVVRDRGACYGLCPGYRLTIRADGSATYNGKVDVALRGTYETQFDKRYLPDFAQTLYRFGIFTGREALISKTDP